MYSSISNHNDNPKNHVISLPHNVSNLCSSIGNVNNPYKAITWNNVIWTTFFQITGVLKFNHPLLWSTSTGSMIETLSSSSSLLITWLWKSSIVWSVTVSFGGIFFFFIIYFLYLSYANLYNIQSIRFHLKWNIIHTTNSFFFLFFRRDFES